MKSEVETHDEGGGRRQEEDVQTAGVEHTYSKHCKFRCTILLIPAPFLVMECVQTKSIIFYL